MNNKDERLVKLEQKIENQQKYLKHLKYEKKKLLKKIELEEKEKGQKKFNHHGNKKRA